jgi:hypothetical protein
MCAEFCPCKICGKSTSYTATRLCVHCYPLIDSLGTQPIYVVEKALAFVGLKAVGGLVPLPQGAIGKDKDKDKGTGT